MDFQQVLDDAMRMADDLRDMVCDTVSLVHDMRKADENILFEGAQARCWISTTAPIPS